MNNGMKSFFQRKGSLLITCGLLLLTAALLLIAYNLVSSWRASAAAGDVIYQMDDLMEERQMEEGEIPDHILNPDMEMPVETIDGRDYIGVLILPSRDLVLPVISQWSYPLLKKAPCRYKGSAYKDDMIIAAHNYSSHFGTLKDLNAGDSVIFYDTAGNIFRYEVMQTETLTSSDVEQMESGEWDLTLFTCTVGGQYRITVRCRRNIIYDAAAEEGLQQE